jgi:hypothetical protein
MLIAPARKANSRLQHRIRQKIGPYLPSNEV